MALSTCKARHYEDNTSCVSILFQVFNSPLRILLPLDVQCTSTYSDPFRGFSSISHAAQLTPAMSATSPGLRHSLNV
jgi:hypothetical protein